MNIKSFSNELNKIASNCNFNIKKDKSLLETDIFDNNLKEYFSIVENIVSESVGSTMLFPYSKVKIEDSKMYFAKALDEDYEFYIILNEQVEDDWIVYCDEEVVCKSFFQFTIVELCYLLQNKSKYKLAVSLKKLPFRKVREFLTLSVFISNYPFSIYEAKDENMKMSALYDNNNEEVVVTSSSKVELEKLKANVGCEAEVEIQNKNKTEITNENKMTKETSLKREGEYWKEIKNISGSNVEILIEATSEEIDNDTNVKNANEYFSSFKNETIDNLITEAKDELINAIESTGDIKVSDNEFNLQLKVIEFIDCSIIFEFQMNKYGIERITVQTDFNNNVEDVMVLDE